MGIDLKPKQREAFRDALASAFRDYNHLAMAVKFGLDETLANIVAPDTMLVVAFQLIDWAESHGRLDGLLAAAIVQNPDNPALKRFAQEVTLSSDAVPDPVLEKTTTIVFDESYRQANWYGKPVIRNGYAKVADAVRGDYRVTSNAGGYASTGILSPSGILILPMPFGFLVDDAHYENITQWVYQGGRLVLLGLYLMERHHYSNLNNLARRFGIEFSLDLTMPQGHVAFEDCFRQAYPTSNRNYWITTKLTSTHVSHPIVDGISNVVTTSSCTVQSAEPPDLLVSTADSVAVLNIQGYADPDTGRMARATEYPLNRHASAPILVALRHGAGRVVGIGSWKMFVNDLVMDDNSDNLRLFRNVVSWLSREISDR